MLEEEEVISNPPHGHTIDDIIKSRLQEILVHLNKSIIILVKDAGPIRNLFLPLRNRLPTELIEALTPVAFIEGYQH